jgi:hypothetical protein
VPSNKFHNVRPTKQVQVGRGLGVGPEVPAAGGFHEFFRVMPKNVNEYRKTNLPGNVNPGKALVAREPNQVVMRKNNVDREFETRGYTGVKSAGFNLQTSRADYSQTLDVANTLQDEPRYGPADGDTYGIRAPYGRVTHSRDDNTDRGKVYVTNLTDADTGLGAYATQETQIRDTDREWGPGGITGTFGDLEAGDYPTIIGIGISTTAPTPRAAPTATAAIPKPLRGTPHPSPAWCRTPKAADPR